MRKSSVRQVIMNGIKADKRVCAAQLSTAPIGESPVAQLNLKLSQNLS